MCTYRRVCAEVWYTCIYMFNALSNISYSSLIPETSLNKKSFIIAVT